MEQQSPPPIVVDLAELARRADIHGPVWAYQGADLNVNLLVFDEGDGVAGHVNGEVDVLLVGIAGEGSVVVDAAVYPLRSGQAIVIPKGAQRSIQSTGACFAYLSCHRRRAGLWPQGIPQRDHAERDREVGP